MCSAIDKLDEYEKYETNILSLLEKAVEENWSLPKIRKDLASFFQAIMVQRGLAGNRAAIKDVLDRHEGTSTRKKDVEHQYAKLSKAELAAMLYKKLNDAGLIAEAALAAEADSVIELT
ncbi:MAG: hypothetical protein A2603_06165 [Bdellovibrionales bacterium RIFOXYD1_FULL_55_31]|nr:MAG: hypothetical protein A2603_06165 [Bdellovibrionales bacterium RIFOXYD1_FULL_55_31]